MLYIVKPSLLKDPRILALVKKNGDNPETNLVSTETRVDSWYAVRKRHPNEPWKHSRELYGKHDGATFLITGSGPSVKTLGKIPKDWVVMSINRSVVVPERVDYWCACDVDAVSQVRPAQTVTRVFGIQTYDQMKGKPFYAVEFNGTPLRWKLPETRPLYWNETTLGWVIHLAIRMGASRIITIGTELSAAGQFDGFVQPGKSRDWQCAQHLGVRDRMLSMFSPVEKLQWYERPCEILDASNGALPVAKVRLADVV